MRGRLALLLIALLVVPMAVTAWLAWASLLGERRADELQAGRELTSGETFLIREETLALVAELDGALTGLALQAARDAAAPDPEPAARGRARVLVLDGGQDLPRERADLSEPARALADGLARAGVARSGYALFPGSAAPALFEVAFAPPAEPKPSSRGGGTLLLRAVAAPGATSLLHLLPARSRLARSLVLPDRTLVARREGNSFAVTNHTVGEPGPALPDPRATSALAPAVDDGGPDVACGLDGDVAWGMLALRDLSGAPVACAVVQAHRADLVAHEPPVPLGGRVRSGVAWVAVAGVVLALALAVLAPRWIWGDIRDSTNSIFHSVERLRELVRRNSRALDEQSRVIGSLTSSTSALRMSSRSIADTTRALTHSAEQSAWVSQSGNQKAELSQRAVLEVRDRVEQISVQMTELGRRCGDIGKILGFIDNLSKETNTLSINASIQAMGAGSSGRQVTVMAGEIRKLADLALGSTHEIQELVGQIQEGSRMTLAATEDGCREVDKCIASFEELESAFARILRWVEETTRGSHGIEQSTSRQSDSLRSVVQSIEELEQRASETGGNFHDVVAAADELARLGADMNETWRVG